MTLAVAESTLTAWRCTCGRLLAFIRLGPGSVLNQKCGKCNKLNVIAS